MCLKHPLYWTWWKVWNVNFLNPTGPDFVGLSHMLLFPPNQISIPALSLWTIWRLVPPLRSPHMLALRLAFLCYSAHLSRHASPSFTCGCFLSHNALLTTGDECEICVFGSVCRTRNSKTIVYFQQSIWLHSSKYPRYVFFISDCADVYFYPWKQQLLCFCKTQCAWRGFRIFSRNVLNYSVNSYQFAGRNSSCSDTF